MLQTSDSEAEARPLFVELDGGLLRSDLSLEALCAAVSRNPLFLLRLPQLLWRGPVAMRTEIAKRSRLQAANLPYNEALLAELRALKAKGRRLVLLTSADRALAESVSDHLGLFDDIVVHGARRDGAGKGEDGGEVATTEGPTRLEAIRASIGQRAFDIIGKDLSERPLLKAAREVMLVTPDVGLRHEAVADGIAVEIMRTEPSSWRDHLRAARPHQWLKNLLVFVPLVLAHMVLMPTPVLQAALAFLAFGLCASSVYLLNDLIDLEADRRHPEKRKRPFASGAVPISHGLVAIPVLLVLALLISLLLPAQFVLVLAVYYAATLAYSLFFKRTLLFDVLVLAGLYTLRLIAGSAAIAIPLSFWLLAFSVFLFFSLALLKRYVELSALGVTGKRLVTGRGYRAEDLPMLAQFGVASALLSVLVLALYIDSRDVQLLYRYPEMIWLLCPVLLYLVTRLWILAGRNEMHEDPIVFAVRDWRSLVMIGIGVLLLIVASR